MTSSGSGGRPVRSNVARRINVNRSASSFSANPADSSFCRMNASISFRTRSAWSTIGISTGCGARKAQKLRSSSLTNASPPEVATSGSMPTSGAPAVIHFVSISISAGSIGFTLTSTSRSRGGISSAWILCRSKLSSGFPGLMAGPDLPPFSIADLVRRSRFASC